MNIGRITNEAPVVTQRHMTGDTAKFLYDKLRPFIRYVEPWGYWLPNKFVGDNRANDAEHWPLAYREGRQPPVPLTWAPKREAGRTITFATFLKAYRIVVVDADCGTAQRAQEELEREATPRRVKA